MRPCSIMTTRVRINRREALLGSVGVIMTAALLKKVEAGDAVTEQMVWEAEEYHVAHAREDFWEFMRWMEPDSLVAWWQWETSQELNRFYADYMEGKRPVLVVMAPPQHGKTSTMTKFLAWVAGRNPVLKKMYASYSDDLGVQVNKALQRIYTNPRYQRVFPDTTIEGSNVVTVAGRHARNSSFIEYIGQGGSFRNTTVGGQINGMGLDLGLVDDPIKGREEAQSETIRNKVWDWFTDDFFGRFSNWAGFIMIMTRWHVDDPMGRFINWANEEGFDVRILRFPAIATANDPWKKWRNEGEPLFPEHKDLEFLLARKSLLTQGSWESLYQQNPIVVGGEMFPIDKFEIVEAMPARGQIKKTVRYWDKAGTEGGGAYTAGVRIHELKDGTFLISDVVRGQWSASEREARMRQVAQTDQQEHGTVYIWVEQEPGSGGKESAERTIMNLRGYICRADRVTGDKQTRAEPYAAQVQVGNVKLLKARWNRDFLNEHEQFPNGKYKDQVDAAGGAFAKCAAPTYGSYDSSYSWL